MRALLKRLFGGPAPAAAEDAPVRTGAKVHPLVQLKIDQRKALKLPTIEEARAPGMRRLQGTGIVWDSTGKPRISADWVKHLDADQRHAVNVDLARRGWKLNKHGQPERIT